MTRFAVPALGLVLALTLACSDDDPTSPETPTNDAPADVDLTTPADGTAGVDGAITLRWNASSDPDGDDITYTVYLGESADPTTEVATDIGATSYETASAWPLDTTYYWKVVASDGEGGESTSPVWSFSTRGNTPPDMFALAGIDDGATGIAEQPTLSWEGAIDPDGDPVVYDVYFDQSANPSTIVAADVTALQHAIAPSLGAEETYFWKVIAKDDKGGERASETRTFTVRPLVTATQVTDDAAFAGRGGHTSVVFDGKMWVIGGETCCGGRFADVWWSTDGATWTLASDGAFPARSVHASIVHDGKMWIFGGNSSYAAGSEFTDVWSSPDGVTWTLVTADAEFGPRFGHEAASFGGKLWVFGGRDGGVTYGRRQAWSSVDGVTWAMESDDTGAGGTGTFAISVFNGALWKTGGRDDGVYTSADGVTWTKITDAPYGNRVQNTSVVFDERLWVLSGSNDSTSFEIADAWSSTDGENWSRAAADAGYRAVEAHTSVTFDDKMWIIGGAVGTSSFAVYNEVYALDY